jgi:hypothetical protein
MSSHTAFLVTALVYVCIVVAHRYLEDGGWQGGMRDAAESSLKEVRDNLESFKYVRKLCASFAGSKHQVVVPTGFSKVQICLPTSKEMFESRRGHGGEGTDGMTRPCSVANACAPSEHT